ncbi:MAG TPA: aspartate carbamoyltransferase [Methanospirillum sp.]|jgi:aspartate carbamoyltransferase catalytic subunit|uniref:aspartate carbamoyltransferase n=1 Tax=Methanospirillum sp. TaxID=45200 RepID=UPI0009D3D49F|nr:aspartate carbamoyltransferase [Methanospirillum sp.]NLL09709.1 aspartate carbamoyltransferase [Methanomicrobiales archaeon]OQB39267.1 MAG: Aspartate carbamoyltransferase [Euryarchaeota archaeon ADurb.Bin165]HPY60006.1 aspartate carbamoyltransferase [Methanospirillum sp.]
MNHIISIHDLDRKQIDRLLSRAGEVKAEFKGKEPLKGKILGLLFFEPSTRTRMSFESAMIRLGGSCMNLGGIEVSSMAKGETLADTIRVVSGYADAIVLRHPKVGAARLASEFSDIPILNGGDGAGQHPSQTLIDLYTIRQSMPLDNIDIGLIGDLMYGRTTHSLAYALTHYNARIHTIAPKGLGLPDSIQENLEERGSEVIEHDSVEDIISDLDVLYVTRLQRERFPDPAQFFSISSEYRITPSLLSDVREHLAILHPLPRVDEIDPAVDSLPYARYFEQARNGVPVRMAMLTEVIL